MDPGDLPVVRVRVQPHLEESHKYKVVWSSDGEGPFDPYVLNCATFDEAVELVRHAIELLIREALAVDHRGVRPHGACTPELRALAAAGAELRKALFRSVSEQEHGERVERWLAELTGRHRIEFVVGTGVYVPWGLIYEGDPDAFVTAAPAAYDGFWAFRYHTSTRSRLVKDDLIRSGERFELIPAVDRAEQDALVRQLQASGEDHDHETRVLADFFAEPLSSRDQLQNHWPKVADRDGLLYFFGHANGTSVAFGRKDPITLGDFERNFKGRREQALLIFLNGCRTARGGERLGWLDVTSNAGFRGFIGTEADIPRLFALRFGLAFVAAYLRGGASVLATMDALRRRHLPLSLLYSVNCQATLRIDPPHARATAIDPPMAIHNFSELKISTPQP